MALFFKATKDNCPGRTEVLVNFEAVRFVYPHPEGAEVIADDGTSLLITASFGQITKALTPYDFSQ